MAAERSRMRRALLAAATCAALLIAATPAWGDPVWRVTSVHGPQQMPPGGKGGYVIQVANAGDTDSSGDVVVTDTLPSGLIASDARGEGWSCDGIGTGVVQCTFSDVIRAPAANAAVRGLALPISITVDVPPGATGTLDNVVSVAGGGAPDAAVTVDPTPFGTTPAGFGFTPGRFTADLFEAPFPASDPARQAGSHPFEARVAFDVNLTLREDPDDLTVGQLFYTTPDEHIRTLQAKLPAGLIGNPQATPRCPAELLYVGGPTNKGSCPANTQVGTIDLSVNNGKELPILDDVTDVPVYNMRPPPGTVAAFGLSYLSNTVWIVITLDASDRYAVVATIRDAIEVLAVRGAVLTLWGVPGDPAHDALRMNPQDPGFGETAMGTPFTGELKPLLTLPSQCEAGGALALRMDSWQHPGAFTPWQAGAPLQMSGCDDVRQRFAASIVVQPQERAPGVPTGLDVDVQVPQKDDTAASASQLYAASGNDRAIAVPPLRDATVTLPQGMVVSPSAANGLAACSSAQIALGTNDAPACPDAAKIGSVRVETPLLPDPLGGAIYLAAQTDNPFGSLLALYLVAEGPGVIVKLPGRVEPDPLSGQLTVTFRDNPQLPFSKLHVHLDGGPLAPLVTPTTCGVKTTSARFTSWNAALPAVQATDSFEIAGGAGGACVPRGFDPSFTAGSVHPLAGRDSPVVVRFGRGDRDDELSRVEVALPPGLLGRVAKLDLCGAEAASAGRCGDGSRIGTVAVGAGPGSSPFFISDGRAYLTGPYGGAPFGLSVVVDAKAGPFDLGRVVVRAAVHVDRTTAVLRVVSDPLPQILAGIPLQVRVVNVTIDRPGFTLNPTNCAPLRATARIASASGATADRSAPFQVTDCAALPFRPRLSLRVGRRGHTRARASTPLVATLRMPPRQANVAGVRVLLPATLNALLPVVERACSLEDFHAGSCEGARIGSAVATTPLLRRPLRGSIHFVKRAGGGLPNLMIALRGQVDFDLVGRITIPGSGRVGADFARVPDVPISKVVLRFADGRNGPLGVIEGLCKRESRRARAYVVLRGQNGKVLRRSQRLGVSGCAKR